jgi:CubicO group peptidase (beta-lactamase class C family)
MRRIILAAAAAWAADLGPSAQAAAQTPAAAAVQSPAIEQALRLLQAAKGDAAGFLAVVHEVSANPEMTDDRWREMRPNMAQWRYHGVIRASDTGAELWVFNPRLEDWMKVGVRVEAAPPHRISGLALRPGGGFPPDVAPPARLAPAELAAAVKAKAQERFAAGDFEGAVLIAKDGKPVLEAAYGLADRATRTPNTVDTQFRFGSMGKMFTAVAVMQLAQAGKLDLKAPLGTYLADYPNADVAKKVTLEHLLSHTGGTGDIFGPQFDAHRLSLRDPKDYVALYGGRGPDFPPGAQFAYSNYGFVLLGRIVEAVSGENYDDYLARHIFAPAGMTRTGNQPETVRLDRATAYMTRAGEIVSAADTLPYRGTPAGGGYSTIGDFLKFANALNAGKLLDSAHLQSLATGGVTTPGGQFIRYDFGAKMPDGKRFYGHAGGAPGMNGEMRIIPEGGMMFVVLANRDPPAAQAIANFIVWRLP